MLLGIKEKGNLSSFLLSKYVAGSTLIFQRIGTI